MHRRIFLRTLFTILVIVSLTYGVYSQALIDNKTKVAPPTKEQFTVAHDLLASWRSACVLQVSGFLKDACNGRHASEYEGSTIVTLYNEDGTIWRTMGLDPTSPNYFRSEKMKDFVPFATGTKEHPMSVILRLIGESASWYKVEINETTTAVKYALRNDPLWSRTNWEGWLLRGGYLRLDKNHPHLLDAPNGKIVPQLASIKFETVWVLKAEGDWAYVHGSTSSELDAPIYYGWVRWRKGRSLTVGCYFNYFEPPVSK